MYATNVGRSTPAGGCASVARAAFRSPRASWISTLLLRRPSEDG